MPVGTVRSTTAHLSTHRPSRAVSFRGDCKGTPGSTDIIEEALPESSHHRSTAHASETSDDDTFSEASHSRSPTAHLRPSTATLANNTGANTSADAGVSAKSIKHKSGSSRAGDTGPWATSTSTSDHYTTARIGSTGSARHKSPNRSLGPSSGWPQDSRAMPNISHTRDCSSASSSSSHGATLSRASAMLAAGIRSGTSNVGFAATSTPSTPTAAASSHLSNLSALGGDCQTPGLMKTLPPPLSEVGTAAAKLDLGCTSAEDPCLPSAHTGIRATHSGSGSCGSTPSPGNAQNDCPGVDSLLNLLRSVNGIQTCSHHHHCWFDWFLQATKM